MNMAAFACVAGREVEQPEFGDDISTLAGLGARNPWLAWPMTIGMLALAGIPGTVGFVGKFQLIHALVNGDYTWLGIVLVIGSMISLGYYLRVVATIWMSRFRPASAAASAGALQGGLAPIAGGSQEADAAEGPPAAGPQVALVGLASAAAVVFFGIIPSPLFTFAWHAGHAITGIF